MNIQGNYIAIPLDIAVPSEGLLDMASGRNHIVGVTLSIVLIVCLLVIFSYLLYGTYKEQTKKDKDVSSFQESDNGDGVG